MPDFTELDEKIALKAECDRLRAELDAERKLKGELLAACEQFVRYAENGKHPGWATYLPTVAGAKMKAAIARAQPDTGGGSDPASGEAVMSGSEPLNDWQEKIGVPRDWRKP